MADAPPSFVFVLAFVAIVGGQWGFVAARRYRRRVDVYVRSHPPFTPEELAERAKDRLGSDP
jgi:hypothetical protein